jgi:hypothetical protein
LFKNIGKIMKLFTSILFSASFAIATSVNVAHVQAQEINQPQANTTQNSLDIRANSDFWVCPSWLCGGGGR